MSSSHTFSKYLSMVSTKLWMNYRYAISFCINEGLLILRGRVPWWSRDWHSGGRWLCIRDIKWRSRVSHCGWDICVLVLLREWSVPWRSFGCSIWRGESVPVCWPSAEIWSSFIIYLSIIIYNLIQEHTIKFTKDVYLVSWLSTLLFEKYSLFGAIMVFR